MIERRLAAPEDTSALGAEVAAALGARRGAIIYLEGPLGAGKTTFARGLLRALGVTGAIRSPTYTLLEPYELDARTIVHLDLYRLNDARELEPIGLRDYAPDACWWLIEWPERAAALLPSPDLRVALALDGAGRRAVLDGPLTAALARETMD